MPFIDSDLLYGGAYRGVHTSDILLIDHVNISNLSRCCQHYWDDVNSTY
jgi:hypothetical protein